MKNLTTTTEQNKKRIKFELKNKKYEIVVNPILKNITVYSNTWNKDKNTWHSDMHVSSGHKVFNNLNGMMQHYKTFDEEILAALI